MRTAIGRRAGSGRRWEQRALAWALGVLTAPLLHLLQLPPLELPLLQVSTAHAAPPRAAASARQKTKAPAMPRGKPRARAPSAETAEPTPTPRVAAEPAAANSSVAKPSVAKPSVAKPEAVVSAPASGEAPANAVVRTEEREGEKTYTFGAQEVEGRLKSPQILYFLRRVRAQFDPAPLGHRSFLLELSDTRRHPALE
jgi:hypothetical protein